MIDPEETRTETSARRINKAAELYAARCDHFIKTLRSNARGLSPHGRAVLADWLKQCESRIHAALDEGSGIPPLGLSDDFDDE
jgi:hypothetical protein